jgi:hypothetical protein
MRDLTPEMQAELRRAVLIEGHDAAHYPTGVVLPTRTLLALLDAAEERDEIAGRLAHLLCDLTGGRMSKTSYPVPVMAQEIEQYLSECHESDLKDERDALAAAVEAVRALATEWATQPNDYDEDTEQQIEDGNAILRAIDATPETGRES